MTMSAVKRSPSITTPASPVVLEIVCDPVAESDIDAAIEGMSVDDAMELPRCPFILSFACVRAREQDMGCARKRSHWIEPATPFLLPLERLPRLKPAVPLIVVEPGRVTDHAVHGIDDPGPLLEDAGAIRVEADDVAEAGDLLDVIDLLEERHAVALAIAFDRGRQAGEAGPDDDDLDAGGRELGGSQALRSVVDRLPCQWMDAAEGLCVKKDREEPVCAGRDHCRTLVV